MAAAIPRPIGRASSITRRSHANVRAGSRRAWGAGSRSRGLLRQPRFFSGQYLEESPFLRDAFQHVQAAVGETEPRAGDEVLDGARDEHLAGVGLGEHALADVHG